MGNPTVHKIVRLFPLAEVSTSRYSVDFIIKGTNTVDSIMELNGSFQLQFESLWIEGINFVFLRKKYLIIPHEDCVHGLRVFHNGGIFVVDVVNFEGFCVIYDISGDVVDGGSIELNIEDRRG